MELAPLVRTVLAVDLSGGMLDALEAASATARLTNVRCQIADLATLDLPDHSVDLIVSNYALHHLEHADKRALASRATHWLRPGGRIVIADMMFGRGGSAHDRRVLREKVRQLLGKGPGGVWRIVKNLVRFGLGIGTERPASPEFWLRALADAGFVDVHHATVIAEAGIVSGRVPLHRAEPQG